MRAPILLRSRHSGGILLVVAIAFLLLGSAVAGLSSVCAQAPATGCADHDGTANVPGPDCLGCEPCDDAADAAQERSLSPGTDCGTGPMIGGGALPCSPFQDVPSPIPIAS
ncbi:MAG: hypothetical protein HY900_22530 [Deltaproteobacteria bacterium]|nr:hypothetical protein [Deltaproteobacteria bacterium]